MQQISGGRLGIVESIKYASFDGQQKINQMIMKMKSYSPETFEHSLSVSYLAGKLGAVLGYTPENVIRINIAGMLHDIGKLAIPSEILHKSGTLTEEEWHIMRQHADIGYRMLLCYITDADILLAVRQHHERMDGTGYPDEMKNGITDFAKIIMLADVFDGLTRKRTYRSEKISVSEAKKIMSYDQNHYDKQYLQVFLDDVI